MVGPATASNDAARAQLYANTAKTGIVFNRELTFYSGSPTTPVSFTGNQALGVSSGGPGAFLINGIGPLVEPVIPCDEPVILNLNLIFADEATIVFVEYTNPLPDDIYVLFSTTGVAYAPFGVGMVGDDITLTFPAGTDLPPGAYSLKILRASDPKNCFTVRRNIIISEAPTCDIEVTGWSGAGIFPNPPLSPATDDVVVSVTGSGFLSGPLTVTIFPVFFGTANLNIDSVTVIDDNNLDVQFDTDPIETGNYGIRVELTSDPTCFSEYGTEFGEDMVVVLLA